MSRRFGISSILLILSGRAGVGLSLLRIGRILARGLRRIRSWIFLRFILCASRSFVWLCGCVQNFPVVRLFAVLRSGRDLILFVVLSRIQLCGYLFGLDFQLFPLESVGIFVNDRLLLIFVIVCVVNYFKPIIIRKRMWFYFWRTLIRIFNVV